MRVRYSDDPRSGQPRIAGHNVAEYEKMFFSRMFGLAFLPWSERGEILMPERNNCAQEGSPAAPEGASCDADSMIWNAKSLQSGVPTVTEQKRTLRAALGTA